MFLSLVPAVHPPQPVAVYWSVYICISVCVCVCVRGNPAVARVDDIACFNRTGGDAGHYTNTSPDRITRHSWSGSFGR